MKKVLKIMNLILLAMSGFAVVCFLALPTISLKAGIKLSKEQITEMIPSEAGEDGMDIASMIPEEGINLDIGIKVPAKLALKSLTTDVSEILQEEVIAPNVENIVDNLENLIVPVGSTLLKTVIGQAYRATYEEGFRALLQAQPEDNRDPRSASDLREAAGLTQAYCMNQAESVMTVLKGTDPTVTKANDAFFNELVLGVTKFNSAHLSWQGVEYQAEVPGNEQKAELKETVKKLFDESLKMVKENGEDLYPLDIAIKSMLVLALRQANQSGEGGGEAAIPEGETAADRANMLKPYLTEMLSEKLPIDQAEELTKYMNYVAYGLFVFAGFWALLFIFTLLRTLLAKKKVWTKTGPIFWILGLVQIVIGVGLTVAVSVALKNPSVLAQLPAESRDLMNGISLTIKTCAFYPSIFILIMIPYMIAYAVVKHKYKRELKAEAEQPVKEEVPPTQAE